MTFLAFWDLKCQFYQTKGCEDNIFSKLYLEFDFSKCCISTLLLVPIFSHCILLNGSWNRQWRYTSHFVFCMQANKTTTKLHITACTIMICISLKHVEALHQSSQIAHSQTDFSAFFQNESQNKLTSFYCYKLESVIGSRDLGTTEKEKHRRVL